MAEEAIKKLEEQLDCSICLDTFTDPKLLQCFHVYCRKCLVPLVDPDQRGKLGLACPICRRVTPVPDRGVAGLQPAFHINHLLEVRESFQKVENSAAALQGPPPTDVNPVKKARYCFVHEGKELKLYCETCGEIICYICALKGGKHHDHDYEQLDQAFKTNTKADTVFSASANMTSVCRDLQLFSCSVSAEVATVGKKAVAVLHYSDCAVKSFECELVSDIVGTRVKCSVEKRGSSQYAISYQPTVKGRHQLRIKAKGQHIRGSPFSVAVKASVKQLGTPILTVDGLTHPWGVAVNQRGEVVVTEETGCRVSVLSYNGKKIRSFGTCGSGQGQFKYPLGVAVDGEGNILVADGYNHRIQKFTAEGHFLAAVGTMGSGGIAFNSNNGKVYVADRCNHRIQVLNSDLIFSNTFGKKGKDTEQFDYPCDIACDSTGKVYVADHGNDRIQIFTAEGKFLRMFSDGGQGKPLNEPIGIAIDASDIVYVSEGMGYCISVFTSEGQFVTSFGKAGEKPGEFNFPCGLAVDDCGVVYVCDQSCGHIQLF